VAAHKLQLCSSRKKTSQEADEVPNLGRKFKRGRPITNLGNDFEASRLLIMRTGAKEENKQKKMSDLLMLLVKTRE